MRALVTIALLAFAGACRAKSGTPAVAEPTASASAASSAKPAVQGFGAKLAGGAAEPIERVLAEPAQFAGRTVLVEGHVRRACTRKGCWMELASAPEKSAPGCRVTFKDYGFFVPTDSAGSKARVEAAVEVAELKPSHVAHLEQEGAHFPSKASDGSAKEVRLVATGVEMWR
jgi:hypothetical protein